MEYEFEIKDLLPIGVTLVVVTIVLAFGLQILGDVKSDMTANSAQANATQKGIEGLAKIPDKMPLIATVVVAVVIIGILVRYFQS
jgi:hypothetical protein